MAGYGFVYDAARLRGIFRTSDDHFWTFQG